MSKNNKKPKFKAIPNKMTVQRVAPAPAQPPVPPPVAAPPVPPSTVGVASKPIRNTSIHPTSPAPSQFGIYPPAPIPKDAAFVEWRVIDSGVADKPMVMGFDVWDNIEANWIQLMFVVYPDGTYETFTTGKQMKDLA